MCLHFNFLVLGVQHAYFSTYKSNCINKTETDTTDARYRSSLVNVYDKNKWGFPYTDRHSLGN